MFIIRVLILLLPYNNWLTNNPAVIMNAIRNLPFIIIGIIVIKIFYNNKNSYPYEFKRMWIAISASFLMYIPVVLFASKYPIIGMLMLFKTMIYIYIVYLGYKWGKSKN